MKVNGKFDKFLDRAFLVTACVAGIVLPVLGNFAAGLWALVAALVKMNEMRAVEGWDDCLESLRKIVMLGKCPTASDPPEENPPEEEDVAP